MKFKMHSIFFESVKFEHSVDYFTEDDAPSWLCEGGLEGSTMDNRWFWNDHVLTLKVGEYVDTDFQRITREE